MKVDEILTSRRPLVAAQEIVRRGLDKGEGAEAIATRWLQLVAVQPPDDQEWSATRTWQMPRLEAVRTLLLAVGGSNAALVRRVLERSVYPNSDDLRLALWVATTDDVSTAVERWATTVHFTDLAHLADLVADDLPLCERILGLPTSRPCSCGKHLVDGILPWIDVLCARQRRGLSADLGLVPGDIGPIDSWLGDERLRMARTLREAGIAIPGLDDVALAWLQGPMWARALRWLAGSSAHLDACVAALVARVVAADDVRAPLHAAAGNDFERFLDPGPFVGPGWGRSRRPRLLRPLTVTLLDRRLWPVAELRALMKPPRIEVTVEDYRSGQLGRGVERREAALQEQLWSHLQEILAEGLLAIALEATRPEAERRRAVRALGELRPGGDGSWMKALSRLKGGPLEDEARASQAAMKDVAPDAELAIADALAVFFEHSESA